MLVLHMLRLEIYKDGRVWKIIRQLLPLTIAKHTAVSLQRILGCMVSAFRTDESIYMDYFITILSYRLFTALMLRVARRHPSEFAFSVSASNTEA